MQQVRPTTLRRPRLQPTSGARRPIPAAARTAATPTPTATSAGRRADQAPVDVRGDGDERRSEQARTDAATRPPTEAAGLRRAPARARRRPSRARSSRTPPREGGRACARRRGSARVASTADDRGDDRDRGVEDEPGLRELVGGLERRAQREQRRRRGRAARRARSRRAATSGSSASAGAPLPPFRQRTACR